MAHKAKVPKRENPFRDLAIEYRPVHSLRRHERNPRTHSRKQIRQIACSIGTFGFVNPILVDGSNRIIAGHGRLEAANLLGFSEVPTIRLENMSEAQRRAYIIADNKLAENAGWDRALLTLELQYVSELNTDLDLTVTGFETAEIDILLDGESDPAADDLPAVEPANAVSRVGDLWRLGPHRLLCGDARSEASYRRLLEGKHAGMIMTDPPYNTRIAHVSGLGKVKHREFIMGSGELSEPQFIAFLNTVFGLLAAHSTDGALHFVFSDWRSLYAMLSAARPVYTEHKSTCIWVKENGGMGSLYRSMFEAVLVFKHGAGPHVNNVELGRYGRTRNNVWRYSGVNSFGSGREQLLQMHPTVKPVQLVADAIKDCAKRNAVILDPFVGSGTTIIAAEQTKRRGYAMELDPLYVDTALRRWQAFTGEPAVHDATSLTFDELGAERQSKSMPHRRNDDVA